MLLKIGLIVVNYVTFALYKEKKGTGYFLVLISTVKKDIKITSYYID
jgi:hypothetical protein